MRNRYASAGYAPSGSAADGAPGGACSLRVLRKDRIARFSVQLSKEPYDNLPAGRTACLPVAQ